MSQIFQAPTNFRQLLLFEAFIQVGRLNPDYPFLLSLNSDIPDAQIKDITYNRFLSDVFKVANILQKSIPKRELGTDPLYISILGRSSYSYIVHFIACLVNHWIPTLISTKNSREAVRHLLSVSHSSYLIADKDFQSYAGSLELDIPVVSFGEVSQVVEEQTFEPEEITEEQRAKERDLPSVYLHTSGSTGHPKIIGITHKAACGWIDSYTHQAPMFVRAMQLIQSPLYHGFGFFMIILISPAAGSVTLITESTRPHTAEGLMKDSRGLQQYIQTAPLEKFGIAKEFLILTVPSILVDIAGIGVQEMEDLGKMTKGVVYGGAPLPLDVGDELAEHGVNIYSGFGMTEIGITSSLRYSPKPRLNGEWRYILFREGYKYHWIPTGEPSKAQLIILPDTDSPAVCNHEDPLGFDTNDVWAEHPSMKGWYRHDGRAGDVTVLVNGEKTDNKQLQSFLLSHNHKIHYTVVFGSGRSQNGLLISPAVPVSNPTDYVNEIWPTIEQMNTVVPAHSRVVKELVLVEDPEIPFKLTDKGTVREKVTLQVYKEKIDQAYEDLETQQKNEVAFPATFEKQDVSEFLRDVLKTMLPDKEITNNADLFEHGMDSLLTVRLRTYIVQLLQKAQPSFKPNVPKNIVYDKPTISALVEYILSILSTQSQPTSEGEEDVTTRVHRTVEKYTTGLAPRVIAGDASKYEDGFEYVVVTGTTGSLGSFLVDQLIDRPSVKRVYCFNRKGDSDTAKRQLAGFKDRGLNPEKLEKVLGDRVVLHDVDYSSPRLGLSDEVYEEIGMHVTHIIHNAWQLNFRLRMEGFERVHIAGVRHLIDLALTSPRIKSPRFVFFSSISTVTNYKGSGGVPEVPIVDERLSVMGYGLSKLVGERICEVAAKNAGLNAAVVRIGQISGSSDAGAWARSEYNPILFRSCFGLGMVPSDLPTIRWIPSNITATVALKQTFAESKQEGQVDYFHLENPSSTPWTDIASGIAKYKNSNLQLVPMAQWLSRLREHTIDDAEKVPAVRLLEFFENMEDSPYLDVKNTLAIAPELDHGPLSSELLNRYLTYQGI